MKIPVYKVVYEDVDIAAFVASAPNLLPPVRPKFEISDVVRAAYAGKPEIVGVVSGVSATHTGSWQYNVVVPMLPRYVSDTIVAEMITVREADVSKR